MATPIVLAQIAGRYGRPDPGKDPNKWTLSEKLILAGCILAIALLGCVGAHMGIF
jgi:hypothetical protein